MGGSLSSDSRLRVLFTLGLCGTWYFDSLLQSGAASSFREIPAHYALARHSAEFSPPSCFFLALRCIHIHRVWVFKFRIIAAHGGYEIANRTYPTWSLFPPSSFLPDIFCPLVEWCTMISIWVMVDVIHRYIDRRHHIMYGCPLSLCRKAARSSGRHFVRYLWFVFPYYREGEPRSRYRLDFVRNLFFCWMERYCVPYHAFRSPIVVWFIMVRTWTEGYSIIVGFPGRSCETVPLLASNQISRTSCFHPLSTYERPQLINDRNGDEVCTEAGCGVE